MRISSAMIYDSGVASIQSQTAALLHTQQQIASGKRILAPSDDPVAATRVLEVEQSKASNTQYLENQKSASESLGLEENNLVSVGNLIQNIRTLAVQAGNASITDSGRKSIAAEMRSGFEALLGLANSADGSGQFQFSGYMGSSKPFSGSVEAGVVYSGDDGQRMQQASFSRQIPISDSGNDIFMRVPTGNGQFITATTAANTGTGVIDGGSVLDPVKWNSVGNNKNFTINFSVNSTVVPSVTTYDVVDNVSGNSLLTGAAPAAAPYPRIFTPGQAINLKSQGAEPAFDYGAQLVINNQPATGDTFLVQPSSNQSVFTTLSTLITSIETSYNGATNGNTLLTNRISSALTNLDQVTDNVLRVRATIGSRMNELDALANAGTNLNLQYDQTLSRLQDIDYAAAISQLTQQQSYLEAAQKSFLKATGLSLFNYV